MRRWSRGSVFMLLGSLMILASAGFWGINAVEERQAGRETERAAALLKEQIADARARDQEKAKDRAGNQAEDDWTQGNDPGTHGGSQSEMQSGSRGGTDAAFDGSGGTTAYPESGDYLGLLSLPSLGLELPVASAWSYPALRRTPCRYSGSVEDENLVILAHNYERHFGSLKRLKPGAEIIFTGLDGTETAYEAVDVRTLGPDQGEEMMEGDWQLLLFTCTYGGEQRVAVRCQKTGNIDPQLPEIIDPQALE